MSIVNNSMLNLLEMGCWVLISKKESELFTRAYEEEEEE